MCMMSNMELTAVHYVVLAIFVIGMTIYMAAHPLMEQRFTRRLADALGVDLTASPPVVAPAKARRHSEAFVGADAVYVKDLS